MFVILTHVFIVYRYIDAFSFKQNDFHDLLSIVLWKNRLFDNSTKAKFYKEYGYIAHIISDFASELVYLAWTVRRERKNLKSQYTSDSFLGPDQSVAPIGHLRWL